MAGWSGETIRETGNGKRIMTRPNVGGLDPQTAALVRAAAALAEGKIAELKQRFVAARAAGVPDLWVEELLLQSLLVGGYPVGAVAVLGTAQELHSHLRGALNTGATREEVEAVLGLIDRDLDPEHRRSAREQWEDVQGRRL